MQPEDFSSLSEIIGQDNLKARLRSRLVAARQNGWQFPHTVFCGNEGMGRRTFVCGLAAEIGSVSGSLDCSKAKNVLDFTGVFSNVVGKSCVLFSNLDQIESGAIQGTIAKIIETGCLEILIGADPAARRHQIQLPPFTMIGTCRVPQTLPRQIASVVTTEVLAPYSPTELASITEALARRLQIQLEPNAAAILVRAAPPTPGAIISLLKRIQKYSSGVPLDACALQNILNLLGLSVKNNASSPGLIGELQTMTGVEFENWTAALFAKHGYTVGTTRTVGDHGIDLEMAKDAGKLLCNVSVGTKLSASPLFASSMVQC